MLNVDVQGVVCIYCIVYNELTLCLSSSESEEDSESESESEEEEESESEPLLSFLCFFFWLFSGFHHRRFTYLSRMKDSVR